MKEYHDPIHPGEILLEDFLKRIGHYRSFNFGAHSFLVACQ